MAKVRSNTSHGRAPQLAVGRHGRRPCPPCEAGSRRRTALGVGARRQVHRRVGGRLCRAGISGQRGAIHHHEALAARILVVDAGHREVAPVAAHGQPQIGRPRGCRSLLANGSLTMARSRPGQRCAEWRRDSRRAESAGGRSGARSSRLPAAKRGALAAVVQLERVKIVHRRHSGRAARMPPNSSRQRRVLARARSGTRRPHVEIGAQSARRATASRSRESCPP